MTIDELASAFAGQSLPEPCHPAPSVVRQLQFANLGSCLKEQLEGRTHRFTTATENDGEFSTKEYHQSLFFDRNSW